MGRSLDHWVDRARHHCGDLGNQQRIDSHTIEIAVVSAIGEFSHDSPRTVDETFAGDGATFDFTLAAATWIPGWSRILTVEYPTGERTPEYLDEGHQFQIVDDNTLRLLDDTPASGQSVKVRYTSLWPTPDSDPVTDLIIGPLFDPVAALAASHVLQEEGARASRRRSKQVAGQMIRDAEPDELFRTASSLRGLYDRHVNGTTPDGSDSKGTNLRISDTDVSFHSLFHGGRR